MVKLNHYKVLIITFLLILNLSTLEAQELFTIEDQKNLKKIDLLIQFPKASTPRPLVIYNHGAILEDLEINEGEKLGYDLKEFASAIASDNFVAFAPIRTKELNLLEAVKVSIQNFKNDPRIDFTKVALIGFSRGGTLTLEIVKEIPNIKAVVLMSPGIGTNDLKNFDYLSYQIPTLVTFGKQDPKEFILNTNQKFLSQIPKAIYQIKDNYPGDHKWFWKVRPNHWKDISSFLIQHLN